MRIYDPRLGKFLSVDPLTKEYPWYTPYQFAGNKPIQFIDLDGLEEKMPAKPGTTTKLGVTAAIDNARAGLASIPVAYVNPVVKPRKEGGMAVLGDAMDYSTSNATNSDPASATFSYSDFMKMVSPLLEGFGLVDKMKKYFKDGERKDMTTTGKKGFDNAKKLVEQVDKAEKNLGNNSSEISLGDDTTMKTKKGTDPNVDTTIIVEPLNDKQKIKYTYASDRNGPVRTDTLDNEK